MKILIAIVLLLCLSLPLNAQTAVVSVSGRVLDSNNNPVPYAIVSIQEPQFYFNRAISNPFGYYEIYAHVVFDYVVRAEKRNRTSMPVFIFVIGEINNLDFTIDSQEQIKVNYH